TRITSSGVSLNTRLKPSGWTKRTVSSAACATSDTPSAICSVVNCRKRTNSDFTRRLSLFGGGGRGGLRGRVRGLAGLVVDGQVQRAGHRRVPVVLAFLGFIAGRRGLAVQALDHGAAD